MEINTDPKTLKFWQDRIAKSNGLAFFLPEKLQKDLKEIQKMEAESKVLSEKVAKLQVEGGAKMNNLWVSVRQMLHENGNTGNWLDELGLDQIALDHGFYVVNILPKGKENRPPQY